MQYLFKNGSSYIYKRRIPNTKKFYTFNLGTKNAKKAKKIVKKFNRLSFSLFDYLKYKTKGLEVDFGKVFEILDNYRQEALVEYSKLEIVNCPYLSRPNPSFFLFQPLCYLK